MQKRYWGGGGQAIMSDYENTSESKLTLHQYMHRAMAGLFFTYIT